MIIFTLRRLLLLLITLFFLTFVGFSLSYFTPHAPLQGASLWNAWLFWFEGVLHWDFGVSSINGQLISEQLREVFPATMELCILAFGFALLIGIPVGMISGLMLYLFILRAGRFLDPGLLAGAAPDPLLFPDPRLASGLRSLRSAV